MGGDFSGKNQDCSKGVYALAGKSVSKGVQIKCVWLFYYKVFALEKSLYLSSVFMQLGMYFSC